MDFFSNLEPMLRTLWFIAIPVTIIFIGQTIMTFMGGDGSDGIDADFDGDMSGNEAPFQLFSFRNLVNFLIGFSWGGLSFYNMINNKVLLLAIAFGIGLFFVFIFFIIIKQLMKLTENNSFKYENVVGKTAEVYLSIPGQKSGKGKVLVSVKGSVHELDAVTENEKIPSGGLVKIISVINGDLLLVESINLSKNN